MGVVVDLRRPTGKPRRAPRPFGVEHFKIYTSRLVFDDGQRRDAEDWQLDFWRDVTWRYPTTGPPGPRKGGAHNIENLLLVPEANGKTTFVGEIALYACDWATRPWIPVGASTRDQAKVLYTQCKSFVDSTPGMNLRFRCYDGYRAIRPLVSPAHVEFGLYPASMLGKPRPGNGIEICPWDPASNDGAIPYPFFICDELHRHGDDTGDLTLWRLWKGKCRKRGAQGIGISTAGEPGTEFEDLRDRVRQRAVQRVRRYGGTHYRGGRMAMYEFMLDRPEQWSDPKAVAAVNPLKENTAELFADELASASLDVGEFKRLKCNIAARSDMAAITDDEWAAAAARELKTFTRIEVPRGNDGMQTVALSIPPDARYDVGLDIGWKHDTTAITPLWAAPATDEWPKGYLLLDEAVVLRPPGDTTQLHPDRVKEAFYALLAHGPIDAVVMDTSDAADIASWLADELGLEVTDRQQGNDLHVLDYRNFMRGLRNCQPTKFPLAKAGKDEAKHTWPLRHSPRCPMLTRHAMNAVGRRLPRGDTRFDRPSQARNQKKQDRRVIDALTAAGMVVTQTVAAPPPDAMPMVAMVGR